MRSNCHLEAWRRYRRGEAVGFCFLPTRYAKLERVAAHPLWWPIKVVGIALQWTCWPLTHVGEFLRSGRWYHVRWIERDGTVWEFTSPDKVTRLAPPLLFRGIVRQVDE